MTMGAGMTESINLFMGQYTNEVISKTSLLSFPQAKRVGNPSEKKDSGQAGMTS